MIEVFFENQKIASSSNYVDKPFVINKEPSNASFKDVSLSVDPLNEGLKSVYTFKIEFNIPTFL